MAYSLHEILAPQVVTGVISREATAQSPILSRLGMAPVEFTEDGGFKDAKAGGNQRAQGLRQFTYDVFNDTRNVAPINTPGSPATTLTRQKVGTVTGTYPKLYAKIGLLSEELYQLRAIGGQATDYGIRSAMGYLRAQQRYLAQQAANFRLALVGGMIRGSLDVYASGETSYLSYTGGGSYTIDWQVPAGNKGQCNMLGTGNIIGTAWDDNTNCTPIRDILALGAAMENLNGHRIDLAFCTSKMWNHILKSDEVQELGGLVGQQAFEYQRRKVGMDINGKPNTLRTATLRALPELEWIITDAVIGLGAPGSEVKTKLIPDTHVFFCPEPTQNLFEMFVGSCPVVERIGGEEVLRTGIASWAMTNYDPAGTELFVMDNALPVNYVPSTMIYAQVDF